MSEDENKQSVLAQYRLQQAEESLKEAIFLFTGGKSPRSVANRLYYGMFYAVLALLIYEPYASSNTVAYYPTLTGDSSRKGFFPKAWDAC